MLMQASCDVSIDGCGEVAHSELVRPEADDFNNLTLGYIAEFIWLLLIPLFPMFFYDSDFESGDELTVLFYPMTFVLFIYPIPFALSVLYMIFGDNVFLFSWVDSVLVVLIEHWVSNTQPCLVLLILYIYYLTRSSNLADHKLASEDAGSLYSLAIAVTMAVEFIITAVYWDRTMKLSIDAIKYLDPSWNKVPSGNLLWPSLFYAFGLVDRNAQGKETKKSTTGGFDEDTPLLLVADF